MINPAALFASVQAHAHTYTALSDAIWDHPEPAFQETFAVSALTDFLRQQGFTIRPSKSGLETAFLAEYGSEGPIIGFLGEYDALPGLSQAAGVTQRQECVPGGAGHGCGHHLLGVGAAAAAVAIKEALLQSGMAGTVRFYGCPAEEFGCGKERMANAGDFSDLDACLTWHPGSENFVVGSPYLANISMTFQFRGISAHAAAVPELGRSALDAGELMNVAANFLREHVPPQTRFHYAFTDCGGRSPNIVPEATSLLYYVRAPKITDARQVAARLEKIAQGAALMTETEHTCHTDSEMYDYIPNHTLGQIMDAAFRQAGVPELTEEARSAAAPFSPQTAAQAPLSDVILPYHPSNTCLSVSSDVGNVSHLVPTAQIYTCCYAQDTRFHTWQMTAQGKNTAAHNGMLTAARAMALCAARILESPGCLEDAWREWAATTGHTLHSV